MDALPLPASVYLAPHLMKVIPRDAANVLDLGFSYGTFDYLLKSQRPKTRIVGIELYRPYIELAKYHRTVDEVIEWDLTTRGYPFPDKEFDVALAIDVIEHLPKSSGYVMLEEMNRVARMCILSTPKRFSDNHHSTLDGNTRQAHLSLWRASEFKDLGYERLNIGLLYRFNPRSSFVMVKK